MAALKYRLAQQTHPTGATTIKQKEPSPPSIGASDHHFYL
jgi:hypothetical protein